MSLDVLLGQWPDEDRRWRLLQNYYFNCIRDCDRHVVRPLQELKATGFDDNTIVVFTADHGELGGAHQMRGKGCNAYREQNHVPLMIVHPAYPAGASVKAVSSHVDIAPTLLALTGMPADALGRVSAGLKGRDLSKTLSAPAQASLTTVRPAALFNYNMFTYLDAAWFGSFIRTAMSQGPMLEKMAIGLTLQPNWRNRGAIRSIFDGRYRFSRYFSPIEFNRPTTYEALVAKNDLEVYDLQEDPGGDAQFGAGRQDRPDNGAERNFERTDRRGSWGGRWQVLAAVSWLLVPGPALTMSPSVYRGSHMTMRA